MEEGPGVGTLSLLSIPAPTLSNNVRACLPAWLLPNSNPTVYIPNADA